MIGVAILCMIVIVVCALNPEKNSEGSHYLSEETDELQKGNMDTEQSLQSGGVETVGLQKENMDMAQSLQSDGAETDLLEAAISAAILEWDEPGEPDGLFHCESHVIFDTEIASVTPSADGGEHIQYVTVYALVLTQNYGFSDGGIQDEGGSHIPTAITFLVNEAGEYILEEYWQASDGNEYAPSIREKFPDDIEDEAMDTQKYILAQVQHCYDQAVWYGNIDTDAVIEGLLDKIVGSAGSPASDVRHYIDANPIDYRELTYYGQYTLQYCFKEFLKGGQTDLRGLLMAQVCQDIMEGFGEKLKLEDFEPASGQEWFEAFRANAKFLGQDCEEEKLINSYPVSWLLLKMESVYASEELETSYETDAAELEEIDWQAILKQRLAGQR